MPYTQFGYDLMRSVLDETMRKHLVEEFGPPNKHVYTQKSEPVTATVAAYTGLTLAKAQENARILSSAYATTPDVDYEWVAEECYCSSTRMPPCSWCTEHCWECSQFIDGCTCEDEEDAAAVVEESESVDPLAILAGYLETE